MNKERLEWQKQVRDYKGKTIDYVNITDSWTTIVFTDKSILSLRDNPELILKQKGE